MVTNSKVIYEILLTDQHSDLRIWIRPWERDEHESYVTWASKPPANHVRNTPAGNSNDKEKLIFCF